jgi:hypothetical protein
MAAALLSSCGGDAGAPPELAIENVTVIDAVEGVRENRTVVVDGGRIVRVSAGGEPSGAAQVVDGTGRYLIPGLWDFHVHLTYEDALTEAMPGLFLSYGITSIRDTGGLLERVLPVVQALRAEGATAPRVFFAGPLLDGADLVYDGVNLPPLGIGNPDVETARRNVAALADAGVDFLKIYEMVTPEVFAALVEEAKARGLPMDGHVPLSMLARDVGPHVNSLEHLRNIEMDCAAGAEGLLAERRRILAEESGGPGGALRGRLHRLQRMPAVADYDEARCQDVMASMTSTTQVPTLRLNAFNLSPAYDRLGWEDALDRLPDAFADEWRAEAETRRAAGPSADTAYAAWSLFLAGKMHEAGVPVGAGTDTPINLSVPGFSLHSELQMLVRAGLSPMEALRAATILPAEFFGIERGMGTVAEGRLADLVLLTADPLEDIANTLTIQAVVTKGKLLDREALDALTR